MVQGRDHLPAARQGLLRRRRRRHRRLSGVVRQARLPAGPRRHRLVAAAVLSLAVARRRLRHFRLQEHQPVLRADARLQAICPRGAPPRSAGHHRARDQSHLGSASLVPARAQRQSALPPARFLRVERHRPEISRYPRHLCRYRKVELGLGPGGPGLLLAPVLFASARSQFRQSTGVPRGGRHHAVLARSRGRRAAARRRALSDRARGHDQREPARDPRRIAPPAP